DSNSTVWAVPHEIQNLHWAPDGSSLSWDSDASNSGSGTTYQMMLGDVSEAGSFVTNPQDHCQADGVSGTEVFDSSTPPSPGRSWFYLVRGTNSCGRGRYETASDGSDRLSTVCP